MKERIIAILSICAGAFFLMIPAFLNGYPIVYSDTSTYLVSGFELNPPFDRPITYGLFLRIASLNGLSLWPVIFFQSLILSYLVFRLLGGFVANNRWYYPAGTGTMLLLALFTGVSWTASQVIADLFTPIMVLTLLVILVVKVPRYERVLLYILFFLSAAMHISHLSISLALVAMLFILGKTSSLRLDHWFRIRPLLLALGITFAAYLVMAPAISKSRHVFLMGAMVENGIAKKFLDEKCPEHYYSLCAYKDSLPGKAWEFIWDKESPFYKVGGWRGTKIEFNGIIRETLTTPKYLLLHIRESIHATGRQLVRFRSGDGNGVFLDGTQLYRRMGKYFARELQSYENSMQNRDELGFLEPLNRLHLGFLLASLGGLVLLLTGKAKKGSRLTAMLVFLLLAVITNAWSCGTFANALDRLGSKMIWLVPLGVIIGWLAQRSSRDLH
ncbi:MAG: hypothetical protein R6U78_00260 [Bacteroidales bacterium]